MELIRGARLWTAVTGEGPPLIVLHGGPGAPDYLGPLAEMLPARVHRYEQRGCGRSEPGPSNTLDDCVADLDALRGRWGLDRCAVGGHSWGAALALLYAMEHPARVTRLLYLNGMGIEHGWGPEHRLETLRRLPPDARRRYQDLSRRAGAAATEPERDRLANEAFRLALTADVADVAAVGGLLERPFRHAVNRALNDEWRARTEDPSFAERVRACRVPALFVQGARDTRPNWPAERLAALLPDARYVALEGAGHFPWVDRPEAFLATVTPFLQPALGSGL